MQPPRHVDHGLFEDELQRSRDVVVPLIERAAARARRSERALKIIGHDAVSAFAVAVDDAAELIGITRLSEGGERHHLVFVR